MEKILFHGVAMGGKIYSLRMAKRMTQEQLAAQLCVSPAAVSKWERNQAVPSVEMLWALADFFDCSMDELAGRRLARMEQIGAYDHSGAAGRFWWRIIGNTAGNHSFLYWHGLQRKRSQHGRNLKVYQTGTDS